MFTIFVLSLCRIINFFICHFFRLFEQWIDSIWKWRILAQILDWPDNINANGYFILLYASFEWLAYI